MAFVAFIKSAPGYSLQKPILLKGYHSGGETVKSSGLVLVSRFSIKAGPRVHGGIKCFVNIMFMCGRGNQYAVKS